MDWRFRGRKLSPGSKHHMEEKGPSLHSLVLRDVGEADLGNYTCAAGNAVGEAETEVELTGW